MPTKENDLLVWHDRYHQAAVDHGTAVGLTAADIANITADNEDLHATITDSAAKDAAAKTATATKKSGGSGGSVGAGGAWERGERGSGGSVGAGGA